VSESKAPRDSDQSEVTAKAVGTALAAGVVAQCPPAGKLGRAFCCGGEVGQTDRGLLSGRGKVHI
jgi:hypothetical protein